MHVIFYRLLFASLMFTPVLTITVIGFTWTDLRFAGAVRDGVSLVYVTDSNQRGFFSQERAKFVRIFLPVYAVIYAKSLGTCWVGILVEGCECGGRERRGSVWLSFTHNPCETAGYTVYDLPHDPHESLSFGIRCLSETTKALMRECLGIYTLVCLDLRRGHVCTRPGWNGEKNTSPSW